MQRRSDHAHPFAARRPKSVDPPELFVPIESHLAVIRSALGAFHSGRKLVVIYGPPGSGRSTVARQVARLLPNHLVEIPNPPSHAQLSEKIVSKELAGIQARRAPLLLVDTLTLEHSEWPWLLRRHAGGPHKTLVVASTAWWLHHGDVLRNNSISLGLTLLDSKEIEHFSNAQRWCVQPTAGAIGAETLQSLNLQSYGLVQNVARLINN